MKIYNAEEQILGRMSTRIVKDILHGETVHIINCEKAVISGNPETTKKHYLKRTSRGDPRWGPFYPKTPVGIVKRTIRGMIPYKKTRGREAIKRLKVWTGIPKVLENQEFSKVSDADVNRLKCKYITVAELSQRLGAKKRW